MEEKSLYTPHDIAIMFRKYLKLESMINYGDKRAICREIDEYRRDVPQNVRDVLHLFLKDNYIERQAVGKVAK